MANSRLYLRSMSDLEARPIPGTDGVAAQPVFFPDGRSIAFWSPNVIKRIAVTGGAAVTICPAMPIFGMNWHDEEILFGQGSAGILRVSANGGNPETIVTIKSGEFAHGPQLLPGAGRVLFTLSSGTVPDAWDKALIVTQSLKSGERKTVVTGGSDARYVGTGHLVYAFGGVVFAVRFDPKRLTVVGGPVPIVEGVRRSVGGTTGTAQFSSSEDGTLAYVPGPSSTVGALQDIGLFDKDGGVQPLKLPAAAYEYPRVSPDGTRVAVGTDEGKEAIIWVYELSGATARRRLTFGGRNRVPVWSSDSQRVAFQSDRDGDAAIFWQRADGSGEAERLTKPETGTSHVPQSWAPDGKTLLFTVIKGSSVSLWTFSLQDRRAVPYGGIESGNAVAATFSPDGRWVAYQSGTTIFVQPYPVTGAKYEISGGIHPFWSPDGKELYFNNPGLRTVVRVITQPTFTFTPPVRSPRPFIERGPNYERNADITPDGKRFVGLLDPNQPQASSSIGSQIYVVEHWFEELRQRVPVK